MLDKLQEATLLLHGRAEAVSFKDSKKLEVVFTLIVLIFNFKEFLKVVLYFVFLVQLPVWVRAQAPEFWFV